MSLDATTRLLKYLHDVGDPRAGTFEPRLVAAGVPIGRYGAGTQGEAAGSDRSIMLELATHALDVAISGFGPTLARMKRRLARGSAFRLAGAVTTAVSSIIAVAAGSEERVRIAAGVIAALAATATAVAEWYDRASATAVQELSAAATEASEAEFLRDLLRSYAEAPESLSDLDDRMERAAELAQGLRALVIKWGA